MGLLFGLIRVLPQRRGCRRMRGGASWPHLTNETSAGVDELVHSSQPVVLSMLTIIMADYVPYDGYCDNHCYFL